MSRTISVSEARSNLSQIVDLIGTGEEVILTRHGQDVAVIVRPDTLRARRTDDVDAVAHEISQLLNPTAVPLSEAAMLSPQRGEALLEDLSAGRSARSDR